MSASDPSVRMYTTRWCGYCVRARMLLESKQVAWEEFDVGSDRALREEMMAASGQRTVPQIWIGELHVGGCDELYALERSGELDELLAGQSPAD